MSPSPFFLKIKSFFVFIWNLIKKLKKGGPNINVERARDVLMVAPTISAGHDAKDIAIIINPTDWPQRARSASSVVPTVLELPATPSLDQRAMLVYKGVMKRLASASEVLDPVLAQALYLCCTHEIAILSKDDELAKFVEAKLEKISTFRPIDGYIPPDIIRWYKRFSELCLKGNLMGVVVPLLELSSDKLTKQHIPFEEIRAESKRFVRWLHTSITDLEEPRFLFKGKYLSVGLVFVAGMSWVDYLTIAANLLKEENELVVVMAYGSDYSLKSANVACFLQKLITREVGLSRLVLTPKFETYDSEPFLASYFHFQPYFTDQKNRLVEKWNTWERKLPAQNRILIMDEKAGFFDVCKLLSGGKTVIAEHDWNTLKQFFDACFQAILQNRAKITCHKLEMRTDGGLTRDKPWTCLSLVLAPSKEL